jgi:hypothetical protein
MLPYSLFSSLPAILQLIVWLSDKTNTPEISNYKTYKKVVEIIRGFLQSIDIWEFSINSFLLKKYKFLVSVL